MKILSVLLLTCSVYAIELKCKFNKKSIHICNVFDLTVLDKDIGVSSVNKGHIQMENIKEIHIATKVESEFLPIRICEYLQFLEKFDVHGKTIKFIWRKTFAGCEKVKVVEITKTTINSIAVDTFANLENLRELYLDFNQLIYLPGDLLVNNQRLEKFSCNNNELEVIDVIFSSSMKQIRLWNNICIDNGINNASEIYRLNDEVAERCAVSTESLLKVLNIVYEKKTDWSCNHDTNSAMLNQITRERHYLKQRGI